MNDDIHPNNNDSKEITINIKLDKHTVIVLLRIFAIMIILNYVFIYLATLSLVNAETLNISSMVSLIRLS